MSAPMIARVLDGYACTRCGAEPAEMVPDGVGARGQLFRCADGCTTIECQDCGIRFTGGRTAARRARWEPVSSATQQALDHGPMFCPDCIKRLLDALIDAIRKSPLPW